MDSACLEAWQAIDLVNVQLALDEQVNQCADFREACLASRKELANKTREFKRADDVKQALEESAVLKGELPKLLRAYREEVDRLTQRAKFAENCFLSMYRLIREAPDPSDALSLASKAAFDAKLALSKAQQEHEDEVAALREALAEQAEQGQAAEGQATAEAQAAGAEAALDLEQIEQELELRYQEQLEEVRAKAEEDLASASMQLEVAQNEIERQQELLRALEQGQGQGQGQTTAPKDAERSRDSRFEEENQCLLADLEAVREEQRTLAQRLADEKERSDLFREQASEKEAQLNRLLAERSVQLEEARRKISACPPREEFDKLRAQLQVIQKEMYNAHGEEDDPARGAAEGADELDGLEAWFINSTRQLKKELMVARRKLAEQDDLISQLKKTEETLGDALRDQRELAANLERDLALGTATSAAQLAGPTGLSGLIAPESLIASAQPTGERESPRTAATAAATAEGSPQQQALKSMLQAVCAQRDRLRAQLDTSEERVEAQRKRTEDLERKHRSLEEDNVQLYQRIRFLQNYKASERSTLISDASPAMAVDVESGVAKRGAVVLSAQGGAKVGGLGRGVEHRYRGLYESDIDPLKAFQQHESERKYKHMPQVERLALKVCNAFLTRSRGRVFVVFYVVLVHVSLLAAMLLCDGAAA